jgi:hypothetical protein
MRINALTVTFLVWLETDWVSQTLPSRELDLLLTVCRCDGVYEWCAYGVSLAFFNVGRGLTGDHVGEILANHLACSRLSGKERHLLDPMSVVSFLFVSSVAYKPSPDDS